MTGLDDLYRKDLFVIPEDSLNDFRLESFKNKNDNSLEHIRFQELVKSNAFKKEHHNKVDRLKNKTKLSSSDEKDIYFLSKEKGLIPKEEKTQEIEEYLAKQRLLNSDNYLKEKFESVKEKLNKDRNPNVANLIKDIKVNTSFTDNLKQEFSRFLNESVENCVDSVRKSVLSMNENRDEKSGFFLTQEQELDEEIPKSRIETKSNKNDLKTSQSKLENASKSDLQKKDLKTSSNMEIALVEEDKPNQNDNMSLIKLKKMLDNIKRIDLPKFQSEIHQVCLYGNDPELLKFVSQNYYTDIEKKQNGLGRYCIHECCINGNIEMLKGILPYVEDINVIDQNGQNAAHIAAKFGQLECLKILTANGLELLQKDTAGMLPCHLAAAYNHPNIIDFWFEMGLSLNKRCNKGKLAIHYASEFGSFEVLKQLCEYYVDISVPDKDGNTTAHLAAKNDRLNCLKYLVKLGLPVDRVRNNLGRNIAHMCCFYGSVRCLHWLFDSNDVDINSVDDLGNSLAHSCCLGGSAECLNCCIQHDVKLDVLNSKGESPLELARKIGKGLHCEKAIKNQITCSECVKDALRIKFEKENEKTEAEKNIEKNLTKIYISQKESSKTNSASKSGKSSECMERRSNSNIARDLVAQYFGPDL